MSQFYLPSSRASSPSGSSSGGSTSPNASDNDASTLPYPKALPRSDFAVPTASFSAAAYLSTLSHRHQTLADLRADLRARSALITRELLDLVNANYADFLSLGQALKGGEERVEEVRVGLLGFRGAVEEVRGVVGGREEEVGVLVRERERVRRERGVAAGLLEVERRVGELETGLLVGQGVGKGGVNGHAAAGKGDDNDDASSDGSDLDDGEDEDEDEDGEDEDGELGAGSISLARLRRLVQQYLGIRQLIARIGPQHPFLVAQEPRITKVRNTLLLDLGAALKQAKAAGPPGKNRVLKIMNVYADMDEGAEAIKVLKGAS